MTTVLPTDAPPPYGGLESPRGRLPLTAMDVQAEVSGLLGATRVRQTFVNAFDEPIEATYVFPLPDRAGVTAFVATLGGRRVEGVLKEREAARDDYDAAIAAGQRAAILEEDRPGVFTARVGNIAAGETAEVDLVLTGPLAYDDGQATFRFPLVVAPRYVPGTPLDGVGAGDGIAVDTDLVPDASRISPPVLLPGQPNPVQLSLEIAIDPLGLPLSDLRSTLHAAVVEQGEQVRVRLRPGERLDRDVVVSFALAGAAAATSAAATPDAAEGDPGEGTFAVTVVPPAATGRRRPLDVAVVLDRSGSMAGWKMVAARRAAARIVDALGARDRLLVLGFDDRIEHPDRLGPALVPATDQHRFAAVEFLARLEARGGTNIHTAAQEAAATLAGGDRPGERVLVLITDGQVGQEDYTLRTLAPFLDAVRVFTVGVDRAVNAGFLQRLAGAGGGRCELVESEDALDEAMARIQRAVAAPLVEDLTVAGADGTEVVEGTLTPDRAPDLYEGAPCVLSGRYRRDGAVPTFRVEGRLPGGEAWSQTVAASEAGHPAIRTVWARAHVRDLEDRYAVAPRDDVAAQIVAVSLGHGVLSRFTAFVAVDRNDPTGSSTPRPVMQPVELPAGWVPAVAASAPVPASGRPTLRTAAMEMAMGGGPTAAAGAPAASRLPRTLARRLRRLLERVERLLAATPAPAAAERGRVASDLDRLAADLRRAGAAEALADAVERLAERLRQPTWEEEAVRTRAKAAVDALDAAGGRSRRAFWV